jgi:vacuolar-type H+-ATPase subunit H
VSALREELAAAQDRISAHQERERLLARALRSAEGEAEALTRTAKASAEETIQRTRAATDEIIGVAQAAATETLAEARATAGETIRAARACAADILEQTRAHAQQEVDTIGGDAAGKIEPLKAAADRLTSDARKMVEDMQSRIQEAAAELSAKIADFEVERDGYAEGLAALITRHAEVLERVSHLQAEVENRLVPALSRLTEGLQSLDTSWLRSPRDKNALGRDRRIGAPHGPARAPTVPSIDGGARRASRSSGEISVSSVGSFREAAKLVRALSGLAGVETVRLRTYGNGVATVDVTAEGSLATLDVKHVDGFSLEVAEASPTRLILQLTRRSNFVLPG